MKKIMLVMGSDSDFDSLKGCIKTLKEFGIDCDAFVCSAHRSPERAFELSKTASEKGYGAIIAAAGKAAHLAGVMAAHTILPVIGIPVKSSTMDGLDSLLSTVQMPKGIPVATVAIDGGVNAAILAAQIFALTDNGLASKLTEYKIKMNSEIEKANLRLQEEIKNL